MEQLATLDNIKWISVKISSLTQLAKSIKSIAADSQRKAYLYDSMNDGNFSAFDFEDDDFSDSDGLLAMVGEEEEIAAMKGRLHRSRQNHHDRRLATSHYHQALIDDGVSQCK